MVTGISNAETVTVTAPDKYTDLAPIGSTVDVLVSVYTAASCAGSLYGSGIIKAGATATISGALLVPGTYAFSVNAKVGSGPTGGCSASTSYTYAAMVMTGPSSVPEKTTSTPYSATGCATPVWSVTPTTYASISSSGVLTTLEVSSNQTVTVRATCGADFVDKTVTITNVASTTPGAPAIGNIVR